MLLIDRTTEALTVTECDLRALIRDFPRTSVRPTDQRSGELTGAALDAFTALTIEDEGLPFSLASDRANHLNHSPTPLIPKSPLIMKGLSPMQIKQYQPGSCLIQAFTTDLALLALVLRHATESESLLTLTPLMSTTLESLATTFETGTLITLEQSGHLRLAEEQILGTEAVQALCQKVVVAGVESRVRVGYETTEGGAAVTTTYPNNASIKG